MSHHPTISAAVITLDEQLNLPTLLPLLDWVDEIIVVDGGSSDATVEIAKLHGCRVVKRPFDNFARQRNHALSLASGDWVFSIDADERPRQNFVEEVRRCVTSRRYVAYHVPIRSRIFGRPFRYSGSQGDRPIRLFCRGAARWFGDVHETLHVSGRVGRLRCWLEHETLPDLPAFLQKMDHYTTIEARARVAAGQPHRRRDFWIAPAREIARRLLWKKGFLDGPQGWAFCLLSGLSEWVAVHKHRRLSRIQAATNSPT